MAPFTGFVSRLLEVPQGPLAPASFWRAPRRLHERRVFTSLNQKTSPARFQAPFHRRFTSFLATRCARGHSITRDVIPRAQFVGEPAIRSPGRFTSTEHFLAT